ncbi:hypothetical protein, partial [Enterobacter asburiae]|uniref:hypothetical protein n=1 Tax=Enterobacter asburiae TaxID=61645 RepID=UPI001F152382
MLRNVRQAGGHPPAIGPAKKRAPAAPEGQAALTRRRALSSAISLFSGSLSPVCPVSACCLLASGCSPCCDASFLTATPLWPPSAPGQLRCPVVEPYSARAAADAPAGLRRTRKRFRADA